MRLLFFLCLASVGWAQKEHLIDFDSPFNKTAIVEDQLGRTVVREVLSVVKKDKLLELSKADGSLIVIPEEKVVAIVPKLPSPSLQYTQQQAAKASVLLQKARSLIPEREEVSPTALAAWEKLANQESHYESESKKARSALIQNWVSKVTLEGDEEKNISLEEYIREGEAFLGQAGQDRPAVETRLEKARQRLAMDFTKVEKIKLLPDWSSVTLLMPMGLVGVLALVSIWGLLNISNFLTALKMTIMSFLSHERSSRVIVMNTKSLTGIVLGPALLYFVYLASRVEKTPWQEKELPTISSMEKRALYLSLNSHFNWSRQDAQKVEVSSENILNYLFAKIENTEPESSYVQYATPRYFFQSGMVVLMQELKVLWIPLQLKFCFHPSAGRFSFVNLKAMSFWLGKLPLGAFVGDYFADGIFAAFKDWDSQLGIDSKAQWSWGDKNRLLIIVPEVSPKNLNKLTPRQGEQKDFHFKKQLSAGELAGAFLDGNGKEYLGRYVDLSGPVLEVVSSHRLGNNLASELLRKTLATQGGAEVIAKLAPKGIEDEPDIFYLSTEEGQGASKIKVKCLVKAPETFFLDAHGDLYREGQNPGSDDPLVKRGKEAHFVGGRVESFERGIITLYDAKIMESRSLSTPESDAGLKMNKQNNE